MHARLRALAHSDIEAATINYRDHASPRVAVEFVDALEAAVDHLRRHPFTGSLRFAYELEIPELRAWPLPTFPYLIFSVPDNDRIDIWRVLHTARDIPAHLSTEPD